MAKKIKLKTKKSLKKRFRKTASGKFLRNRANRRHLLADKSSKKKRQSRGRTLLDPTDVKRLKKLLVHI